MTTYPVSRYLGIDRTESPTVAVDGTLVFLADTTGTPQVWRLSEPAGWPDRLTGHDERVSFVDASPTRSEVIFGMDEGSNERDQLFRYDLETGEEVALTDAPESKHLWGGWNPTGDRFAFASNRREDDTFDVYVQDRDAAGPDAAELVHEGPGGFLSVECWHPDGDALVLSKANASYDQDLFLLDLGDGDGRGTAERVTDDEEARYTDVQFGPDGGLLCVTNHGTDTAYVGRIDLDSGEVGVVEDDGDWNVDGFDVDADTGRVVYTRNVDGYSDLRIGTLDDGDVTDVITPDLPEGVVEAVTLGPDADRAAVTFSASDHPFSVHVADAASGDVTRWTAPGTLGIPEETFQRAETIRYETFDGREIPAYWTLPDGVDAADPDEQVPVIVDVHGGPEHQRRPWFYPTKQYFLNRGYAVLEPNVRGSSGYGKAYTHLDDVEKRMDSVKDVEYAVDWLADQPAVDDDRVVAYGRSYGGFMVLAAITEYPDLWAAAVDFVGIANFVTFLENTGEWRRSHRESEYGSLESDRELLEELSPIHDVDRIQCPLFIQHGANDPRVPVGEAEQIAEAVRDRGIPVETCIFEDEGHHTTSRENQIEEFERIAAFLDEHV